MLLDQFGNPLKPAPDGYFDVTDSTTADLWGRALDAECLKRSGLLFGPALVDSSGKPVRLGGTGQEIRVRSAFARHVELDSIDAGTPIMILDKET
jgi:hypothetical protein